MNCVCSRGFWLIVAASLVPAVYAQSARPDIDWMAGGHVGPMVSVAYSPDGSTIATSGHFSDSTVKLWRASDGKLLRTLNGSNVNPFVYGPFTPIGYYPDGRTIVSVGEAGGLSFWNTADGALRSAITLAHTGYSMALDPTGTWIAVGTGNHDVEFRHASDGSLAQTVSGPTDIVSAVTFSADGTLLAAGDRTGRIWIWRVSDRTLLRTFAAHVGIVNSVAFSPDGSRIASGSDDLTVRLWSTDTGTSLAVLNGHSQSITKVAFSPDGQWLASSSWDHTVRLWQASTGSPVATLDFGFDATHDVAFNPASNRLVVAADREIREYDVATHAMVRSLLNASDEISCTRFSPDGSTVVEAGYDGQLSVYDISGKRLQRIDAGQALFTVATDGNRVATTGSNQAIRVYDLATGALIASVSPGTYTYGLAFSPDHTKLAAGNLADNVQIWDTTTWTLIRTLSGHTWTVNDVAYAPDGRLLSASSDRTVKVWDGQGNLLRTLTGAINAVNCVSVSPDGQFAIAGDDSGQIYMWQLSTGQLISAFSATSGSVLDVGFTPSGFAFYSVGGDRQVHLWQTSNRASLASYSVETGGVGGNPLGPLSIAVSPDGRHVVYGRDDATVVMSENAIISAPDTATAIRGSFVGGSATDLGGADDGYLRVRNGVTLNAQEAPIQLDLAGHTSIAAPTGMSILVEAGTSIPGLRQEVWLRNVQTGQYEMIDAHAASVTDQSVRVELGSGFLRYIEVNGNVRARLQWRPTVPLWSTLWQVRIDQAIWSVRL